MTSAKPTLKTIAKISGLAVPTVSRALNDAPDIGAETKKTVRRIADEIGYVPNRAGVRLRTGRTNVISLVMSTERDMMNHTAQLISSLATGLRNTPYHLNVTPFFPDEDPMTPIKYIVETQSADGVIINQIQPNDPRIDYLMKRNFPFATHGRSNRAEEYAYFDYDNTVFGRCGVGHLANNGRKNLVMVAPPLEHSYSGHMVDGARAEANAQGLKFRAINRVTSDAGTVEVAEAITQILREDPSIDGIICGSTNATFGSVAAIEEIGRRLGKDIDVLAKEAFPILQKFRPEIIVVNEDVFRAGEFLAKAVIQAIRTPEEKPMQGLEIPDHFQS